ncbi:MAG: acylphosphatase [Methanococcoides sp.]|nr:acylphosphatase [Methanococcoides sp.]
MNTTDDVSCAEIYVSGRVQGVYFRGFTQKTAASLGLMGYAQNLPDGRVKVVAQGKRSDILELLDHLHIGPELSNVESIEVSWMALSDTFTDFLIKR